jgi:hypothetical protein
MVVSSAVVNLVISGETISETTLTPLGAVRDEVSSRVWMTNLVVKFLSVSVISRAAPVKVLVTDSKVGKVGLINVAELMEMVIIRTEAAVAVVVSTRELEMIKYSRFLPRDKTFSLQ